MFVTQKQTNTWISGLKCTCKFAENNKADNNGGQLSVSKVAWLCGLKNSVAKVSAIFKPDLRQGKRLVLSIAVTENYVGVHHKDFTAAPFFELVRIYKFIYLVFTGMPGGVTVGDSGLCCYFPCLLSASISLCLMILESVLSLSQIHNRYPISWETVDKCHWTKEWLVSECGKFDYAMTIWIKRCMCLILLGSRLCNCSKP